MLYFKVQGLPRINTVALQKSSLESLKTSGVNVAMPKIHSTAGRFCSVASIPRYHHTFERRPVLCTSSQNAVQSCQTATKSSCNMRERHCKTALLILKIIGASNLYFIALVKTGSFLPVARSITIKTDIVKYLMLNDGSCHQRFPDVNTWEGHKAEKINTTVILQVGNWSLEGINLPEVMYGACSVRSLWAQPCSQPIPLLHYFVQTNPALFGKLSPQVNALC